MSAASTSAMKVSGSGSIGSARISLEKFANGEPTICGKFHNGSGILMKSS